MASTITQGSTTISLAYDANHQRVRQQSTVGGVTTITIYLNDPMSGAMSEWVQVGSATPAFNDYLSLDGQIVAQRSVRNVAPLWGSGITWGAGSANPFAWGAAPGSLWGSAAPANPPRFTWGADPWSGPVVSWAYFVLDNLGSVAVVTDQGANVTARLSNDSWGKQRNANGTDAACNTITAPTTRGFTNQEEVAAACLVNLNARMYDPSIGKFLAPDPVLSNPLSLQGINAYAYVQNNPLSLVDPTGLYSIDGMETVVVEGIRPKGAPAPTTGCAGSCFPSGSATIPPWVTLTDYRGSTTYYDAPADYGLGVLQPLGPPGGTAAKGGIGQVGSAGNPSGLPPPNSVLSNPMLNKKFASRSNQTLSGGANTNAARYKDGGTGAGSDASDGTNGAAQGFSQVSQALNGAGYFVEGQQAVTGVIPFIAKDTAVVEGALKGLAGIGDVLTVGAAGTQAISDVLKGVNIGTAIDAAAASITTTEALTKGGAYTGALIGTGVGTVVPGAGNAVGAAGGALVGGVAGGITDALTGASQAAHDYVISHAQQ